MRIPFGLTFWKKVKMGNRNSYVKLPSEGKVCVVFPCYLAIHRTTHRARCVCQKGKKTDNPDEMVVLINRFYLPDKKIGLHFFKQNNNYYGEPFLLENCLINMYPTSFVDHEKIWEKPITKKLYNELVDRYDWIYDADGKQKVYESYTWPFIWPLKQKKELTRLNNEVSLLTDAQVK